MNVDLKPTFLPMFSRWQRTAVFTLVETIGTYAPEFSEFRKNGTSYIGVRTKIGDIIRVSIRLHRPVITLGFQTPYLILHDGVKMKWVDPKQVFPRQWNYTTKNLRLYRVEHDYLDIEEALIANEAKRALALTKTKETV